jgi:hypothetical protein
MVNSSRRRRPMSGQGGGSTGGWSVTSSPVEVTTGDRTVSRRRCLAPVPKASLARLVSTGRDRPDAETARIAGIPAGADAASAIGAQRDTSHVGIVTRMARHIRVHLVASRPGGKGMRMLAAAGDWILEVLVPADQRPPAARRPPPTSSMPACAARNPAAPTVAQSCHRHGHRTPRHSARRGNACSLCVPDASRP